MTSDNYLVAVRFKSMSSTAEKEVLTERKLETFLINTTMLHATQVEELNLALHTHSSQQYNL